MSDGDAIVVGILVLAVAVTPVMILCAWLDLRRCIRRSAGDPRREF